VWAFNRPDFLQDFGRPGALLAGAASGLIVFVTSTVSSVNVESGSKDEAAWVTKCMSDKAAQASDRAARAMDSALLGLPDKTLKLGYALCKISRHGTWVTFA